MVRALQGVNNSAVVGFINGVGDSLENVIEHPVAEDFGLDASGQAAATLNNFGSGVRNLYQQTQSTNPYISGHAFGQLAFAGASVLAAREAVGFAGDVTEIGAGFVYRHGMSRN